jgi:hypothetical protein
MAWETRERGGAYYTRSRKVGGRVVREYVGAAGSPTAQLAAAEDALRREHREREQAGLRSERERDAAAERPLEVLAAVGEALLGATLLVAGYHQHDRGGWRKRRG